MAALLEQVGLGHIVQSPAKVERGEVGAGAELLSADLGEHRFHHRGA